MLELVPGLSLGGLDSALDSFVSPVLLNLLGRCSVASKHCD